MRSLSVTGPDELGDYDAEAHTGEYVSSLKIALRQSDQLEKKAMELHQKRDPGQEAVAVYDEFVGIARSLETYGIDPHPVKDHRGTQLYLGINFSGISTFAAGRRTQHFRWPEVHKINFEGKMFIIHLAYSEDRREVVRCVALRCGRSYLQPSNGCLCLAEKAHRRIQVSVGCGLPVRVAMFHRADAVLYVSVVSGVTLSEGNGK